MAASGYKKYMKKSVKKDYSLIKLFIISFFVMLLISTYIFKSLIPSVDVSIGDYKQEPEIEAENILEIKTSIDNRLAMIQNEDQGKTFTEMMKNADDSPQKEEKLPALSKTAAKEVPAEEKINDSDTTSEPVYKIFIGTYTSAEQAKVAKDIILESGSNLNPIVKCIGSNNYTLQVGIFKNKASAETLLYSIQQNNLPARLVQEF